MKTLAAEEIFDLLPGNLDRLANLVKVIRRSGFAVKYRRAKFRNETSTQTGIADGFH